MVKHEPEPHNLATAADGQQMGNKSGLAEVIELRRER
jgi:hypothetical protein